ncbi:MAG: SoxR reducing system RseC family protein [Gallionella sp.]
MLETRATVIQILKSHALVQANQGNGCEQCDGKGCGTGKLAQLFCSKPRLFQVDNPINAGVGDEVVISVAEGAILRGIGVVYLLPLLLLLVGAMLGNLAAHAGQTDTYAASGGLLGLFAGFVLAKRISSSRQVRSRFQPYIARQCRE